jgi:hypothetical protein
MKLLILGNGFDIASGLPTKYVDFFEYILEKDENTFYEIDRFLKREFESKSKQTCIDYYRVYDEVVRGVKSISKEKEARKEFEASINDDKKLINEAYDNFLNENVFAKSNFWIIFFWIKYRKNKRNRNWFEVESEIKDFLLSIKNKETDIFKTINDNFFDILKIGNLSYYIDSDFNNILKNVDESDKLNGILFKYYHFLFDLHNKDIYYGLFMELMKFEDSFKKYIHDVFENFVRNDRTNLSIYRDNFIELVSHETLHENYSILNFNYTCFIEHQAHINENQKQIFSRKGQNISIQESNIHGNYQNIVIFGIDLKNIKAISPLFQFTKTYRKMLEQDRISRFNLPSKSEIDEIIFFGHSLSDADYSYFQSIFDFYDIYQCNIKLTFCYSEYSNSEKYSNLRREQINKVALLLNKYGKTIGNNDRGENLTHKLLLENRLAYRIINLKKVNVSKLYFALKEFRDFRAKKLNLNVSDFISHKAILEIVNQIPKDFSELSKIKGISKDYLKEISKDILNLIDQYKDKSI